MSQQQRVNSLAEGISLAFVTAVMGALAIYFLPIKFLVDLIWGIPLIFIIKKYDLRVGILTLALTFFLTWLVIPPIETLLSFIILAPLALAYGLLFKAETSAGHVLLIGSAVSVLSTVAAVLLMLDLAPQSIMPSEQALRVQAEQSLSFYTNLGLINPPEAKTFAETGVRLMRHLIPGVFAIGSLIRAFFTYILAVKVLQRLKYRAASLPPFSEWRLPWYSVWLLITGLGLTLLGDQFQLTNIAIIGKNVVFLVFPVFLTIGLAVATHFLMKWKLPTWIKVVLGVVTVVNLSGSLVLFTLIGVFDPLMAFRKWKKPES